MYRSVPVPPRHDVAITGARILPIANADGTRAEPIETGTIVISDGVITAVGADVEVPEGAEVIEAAGRWVLPGFIEAHGHLGVHEDGEGWSGDDTNEMTDPNGAGLRALDGIDPADLGFKDALRGGVTSALIKPGSGNPIGGRTAFVKTWGRIVDEMLVTEDLSVKSALGENPKRVYGDKKVTPSTRMGTAKIIRDAFVEAQNYQAKRAHAEAEGTPFERDLVSETLAAVLDGTLAWDQHCHRADDIATAIRLSEEFGYRLVINHGTEGHKIADYIAEKGIDVILGPLMTSRSKVELRDRTLATAAALAEAGVRIALTTDHPVIPINFLIHEASLAVKEGLGPVVALEALTINPAAIFGLDDRLGSLAPGRDADLVVWSGDPLDLDSRAEQVFVDGRRVYAFDADTGTAEVADPFGPTLISEP
ncbi:MULTISPECIES: amidohydrolase [unclassified Brevibacterium]|uniref:amidohydrolase n=1 Tax=unclassified Brevibacterium TaxID=2614124 RepID=UPI0010F54756|nr:MULTISPECIES: amidohydrolase [unclassified Brevibacterium]MCM1011464.1 amidohydrolase [Brevibacterium sp. XM4083]